MLHGILIYEYIASCCRILHYSNVGKHVDSFRLPKPGHTVRPQWRDALKACFVPTGISQYHLPSPTPCLRLLRGTNHILSQLFASPSAIPPASVLPRAVGGQ